MPNWDTSILHKSNSDVASFAAILHMIFILVVLITTFFCFVPSSLLSFNLHTGREATGAALRLRITPALLSSVMMTDVFCEMTTAITRSAVCLQSKVSYFHHSEDDSQNKKLRAL